VPAAGESIARLAKQSSAIRSFLEAIMNRALFLVSLAAPVLALACSGSPDDPAASNGENLNWHGYADGAAPIFDGALPPFPGLGLHGDLDAGFPFPIPDGGHFEIPDGGFGNLPPWFKWPDGKFHVEPCTGGFKFALPGGGFACPEKGGGFTFEGRDAGFEPPPEWPDSGFVPPVITAPPEPPRLDAGHEEPPPFGNKHP
jgi:hypothetical protein